MPKSAKHVHHRATWEPVIHGSEIIRSSIGGYPVLPAGQSIPVCGESGCGKPMSLFLQLAMEDRFGLPFEAGSVLSVFQCIEHDDPFEELDTKSPKKRADLLPDDYWNHTNYALFFASPACELRHRVVEDRVRTRLAAGADETRTAGPTLPKNRG